MTVVAAIARDGKIVMAADTQTNYCDSPLYGARKIRRLTFTNDRGDVLIAAAGNGALTQVVARHLKIAAAPSRRSRKPRAFDEWAEAVAEAVTGVLADTSPPLMDASDGTTMIDGALLLGHAGRLWYLFTHQAVPVPDGVAAIGMGGDIAIGSIHTALQTGVETFDAATNAVLLACRFARGCGVDESGPLVEHLPG